MFLSNRLSYGGADRKEKVPRHKHSEAAVLGPANV